jgi:Flp pilus assembly protein TadD
MRCARILAGLLAAACLAAVAHGADDPLRAAEQQFATGNYAAAVTTLQGVLTRKPQDAQASYWLGRCYYELRDYDNAASQLEQAAKFDPKNSEFGSAALMAARPIETAALWKRARSATNSKRQCT